MLLLTTMVDDDYKSIEFDLCTGEYSTEMKKTYTVFRFKLGTATSDSSVA